MVSVTGRVELSNVSDVGGNSSRRIKHWFKVRRYIYLIKIIYVRHSSRRHLYSFSIPKYSDSVPLLNTIRTKKRCSSRYNRTLGTNTNSRSVQSKYSKIISSRRGEEESPWSLHYRHQQRKWGLPWGFTETKRESLNSQSTTITRDMLVAFRLPIACRRQIFHVTMVSWASGVRPFLLAILFYKKKAIKIVRYNVLVGRREFSSQTINKGDARTHLFVPETPRQPENTNKNCPVHSIDYVKGGQAI